MEIKVKRYHETKDFTIGKLFVDGVSYGETLEDEGRDVKVMHETRIPTGTYKIKLRTFGGHHEKYKVKFPESHKGMLWLQDVPGFKDILIHIGNTDDDSSGCILVGKDYANGVLKRSTMAYIDLYKKAAESAEKGELSITVE